MHIIVEKSNLLDGLKKVGVYVGKKSSYTVLQGVKITTVSNDKIEIVASDSDTYISTEIEAQVISSGAALLQYSQFNDFLKKSKATTIELQKLDNNVTTIKAKNIDYKLISFDVDRFPTLPNYEYSYITLSCDEYKRILNNTTYALATSESRPVLTGLNIRSENGKLHFTATDSHRLARYSIATILNNIEIVPGGEAIKNTLKVTDKNTKDIKLGFSAQLTLVQFDSTKIYIRNLEGNYPDTSRLIPDSFKTTATINAAETLESLEMLHTLSKNDRNNVVSMELNGKIELKSNASEIGEMKAALQGEKEGEDLKIAYSNVYMRDVLKALNQDEVNLNFSGSMRPFTATAKELEAVHLILPVRQV